MSHQVILSKNFLMSARRDSSPAVTSLKYLFYDYQRLLLETLKYLRIITDSPPFDNLANRLHQKLNATYADWESSVSIIEFTLALFINNTCIGDYIPIKKLAPEQLQLRFENAFQSNLLNSISAHPVPCWSFKLKYRPTHPEKPESYMGTLRGNLNNLYGILYEKVSMTAVWKLDADNLNPPQTNEQYIGLYPQFMVPESALEPGGKYRAICKIIVHDKYRNKCQGTGFLIDDRTVITVAHNVLHDFELCTFADRIDVHIGYWGSNHIQHETRTVIRVSEPFRHVDEYLRYETCPAYGAGRKIAVVGYPCNIPRGAGGQYMYESQGITNHDLIGDKHVLTHLLDTRGGNSGSPVLELQDDEKFHVIGVHHAGSIEGNKATALGYRGNDISASYAALTSCLAGVGKAPVASLKECALPYLRA
ncbi:hypothetical protein O1611_g3224 [Lasiodiplodia mahajangana]|uniref:Uncharacterized protein n=1 Tax=Lasiodiplodia mahajangana TaxID=1108764 RepID=A0ACC2JT19_9PEZI|nr:hypothetical protein O1611_g3224 [Lasiodiplodia mahajangana]